MREKVYYHMEKKRLTEKQHQPTDDFVQRFVGETAWNRLMLFEELLRKHYDLDRQMRFPFGSQYGWGFRYAHKKSLLLYVFFEEDGFCCTISISDVGAPRVEAMLDNLHPAIQDIWRNRYPCGETGGWLNRSVTCDEELPDLIRLIGVKVKPAKAADV